MPVSIAEIKRYNTRRASTGGRHWHGWSRPRQRQFLFTLQWLAKREDYMLPWATSDSTEKELRDYSLPLFEVFQRAASEVPSISVSIATMGGAPCVAGTRIPVYGILDALEDHGTFEGVRVSYPRLSLQQIRDAILYAKLVVESPVGE